MTELFVKTLNMSISACWLILAVLLLRLALKKAPQWVRVLLWGIVAVRLLCPFSIESPLSLLPRSVSSGELVSEWMDDYIGDVSIIHDNSVYYDAAVAAGREPVINDEGSSYVVTAQDQLGEPSTVENTLLPVLSVAWMIGMAFLLLYAAVSYLLLRKKVATAIRIQDELYQSENVSSPFVLGIIKPRIYLPFEISEKSLDHVIAHERAHICRKDHWWKPLGFLLLAIHWFNPFIWLAYVLLCRDIELACDEKVIKALDMDARADYSAALLSSSVSRHVIAACPLAFGEISVKTRIKSVLHYKKPAFWIVMIAVTLCVIIAACFLTDPVSRTGEPDLSFLNYENAISLAADRGTVQVIYCPPVTDQAESFINIGAVNGNALASYLDFCQWREVNAPHDSLASPGSVEFVIEDEYRITVYDRKGWFSRQYAKVSYYGDVRYYATRSPDYDNAVELIHSLDSNTQGVTDGQYYLLIGEEGVTKIQVSVAGNTEIQRNLLGLPFSVGQEVRLEALDGVTDLRGVSVTAFDSSGEIIYALSVPTNATNKEIIDTVASDDWLRAPTVAIGPEENGKYVHIISMEGVAELKLTGKNFGGGCVPADGSTFPINERVWLQPLDGFTDLEDVTVTALDKDGNILYSFLLVPNKTGDQIMEAAAEPDMDAIKHDLRTGDMELPVEKLGNYVFVTNSAQISITVKKNGDFEGDIRLLDHTNGNAEIMYADVSNKNGKCVFTNLTSARLYAVTCEDLEGCTLIVSDNE